MDSEQFEEHEEAAEQEYFANEQFWDEAEYQRKLAISTPADAYQQAAIQFCLDHGIPM